MSGSLASAESKRGAILELNEVRSVALAVSTPPMRVHTVVTPTRARDDVRACSSSSTVMSSRVRLSHSPR